MTIKRLGNGKRSITVDGSLIARCITGKGTSVREIARQSGLTIGTVYLMMKNNEYSIDLPLRHLADMAEALDITVRDLLNVAPAPHEQPFLNQPERVTQTSDTSDVVRLARYLAVRTQPSHPEDIALTFGWTLEQLEAARRTLDAYVEPLGITACHANDDIYLTTRGPGGHRTTADDLSRVRIASSGRRSMNTLTGSIVHDALLGEHKTNRAKHEMPYLAEAVNLGYLHPRADNTHDLVPSDMLLDAFPD